MGLYLRGSVWWLCFMDPNTGEQVRCSTETENKDLAKRIFDKIKGQVAEGKWFERMPGQDILFKEAIKRYMREYSQKNKAPKSYIRDECSAKHLIPAFGDCFLTEIVPANITKYKGNRREAGASARTVNLELALMSHIFTIAMKEWGWIKENPVRLVSRERMERPKERWLSLEEEEKLLKASRPWLQDVIIFAIHTGFRQSEILDLKWSQVDLHRETIMITEQKNRGVDTLPLDETALSLLRRKKEAGYRENAYVFPNHCNGRMNNRNLLRAFYIALEKAGIQGFRFHDLRHTFATRLVQDHADLYSVQMLGRWKDATMVRRYAHHNPESLRSAIKKLDSFRSKVSTNLAQSPKKRGHKPYLRLVTP